MSVSSRPRLVLVSGSSPEHSALDTAVELTPGIEVILGRGPESALPFEGAVVSKRHARLWLEGGQIWIEDLSSTNGTFVNGRPLEAATVLEHGAILGLGEPFVAPQTGAILVQDRSRDLLAEMQLFEFSPEPASQSPEAEEVFDEPSLLGAEGATPPEADSIDPLELLLSEEQGTPSDSGIDGEAEAPVAPGEETRSAARALGRLRPILVGVALALAALAIVGVSVWQSGAPGGWRDVRVAPAAVRSGTTIVISSGDIEAKDDLEVFLADQPAKELQVENGQLRVTTPRLTGLASGEQPVALTVLSAANTLLRTSVIYEARPEVLSFSPATVRVGDLVTLSGVGFRDIEEVREGSQPDLGRFQVKVGGQNAEILRASTTEVVFRTPLVTRRKEIELPISLALGGGSPLEARDALKVAPRIIEPLEFDFVATYEPGLDAWQISSPLGVAFYLKEELDSGETESREVPARVAAACSSFTRLFREAPDDPELRVVAEAREDGYALERVSGDSRTTLVEFGTGDLATAALGGGTRVEPHILTFWQATVWNYLLDAFSRGVAPETGASSPAYQKSLAQLVENNRSQGGYGRPEQRDLATLPDVNRAILSSILFDPPAGFGDLSGVWTLMMANVFYPTDDIDVSLTLEVQHDAADLSGTARLEFRDDFAYVRKFESRLRGSVEAGSPPTMVLEARFEEPIGLMVLQGVAEGWELSGTFKAGGRKAGEWFGILEVQP